MKIFLLKNANFSGESHNLQKSKTAAKKYK